MRHDECIRMPDSPDGAKCRLIASALRSGQRVQIRALGVSMMPTVWPGDTLSIEPEAFDRQAINNVVVFTREDRLFAHRVRRREGALLLTQGDRVAHTDAPVGDREYLGRVVSIIRAGRERKLVSSFGTLTRVSAWVLRWNRATGVYLRIARLLQLTDYRASAREGAEETLPRTT